MRSIFADVSFWTWQHGVVLGLLAGVLTFTSGCANESPERSSPLPSDTTTRQAALTVLDSLRQDAFRSAFANLEDFSFTRHTQTMQIDADGEPRAQRSRVLRYDFRGGRRTVQIERADSTGTFDLGFLGRFADRGLAQADVENMGQHIVGEEPPYLTKRSREAYSYRLIGDTLLGNREARTIAIQMRPDASNDQAIKRARLYVDRTSDQLVGLRLMRQSQSMLLSERSHLDALLQPMDTSWVPAHARFETHLDMPIWGKRTFHTTSSFTDYAPGSGAQ